MHRRTHANNEDRGPDMRRLRRVVGLVALGGLSMCGCAENEAVRHVGLMIREAMPVLLEKAQWTANQAQIDGAIRDPVYTLEGYWVTGLHAQVGVRGVELSGRISAIGSGTDRPLSEETLRWLREQGLSEEAVLALIERLSRPTGPTRPP